MSALRAAMRWLPMARARVTVGSRPSGTLATMILMLKIALVQNPRPIPRRW